MMSTSLTAILADLQPISHRLYGKTVLLTGAGGFLGRWIVRALVELNRRAPPADRHKIIAIDTATEALNFLTELRDESCDFIHSDLSRGLGISRRIDFAIHAAGIASPFWYKRHPLETVAGAVDGSRNVLGLLQQPQNKGARYLFFSTSEVYQTPEVVPTPETYVGAIPTMSDRSCYDVSKALGETLAYIYQSRYGIDTGVVRIFNSFGAGLAERDHRILSRIASALVRGYRVQVYRSIGLQPTRTYCPVADTISGCLRALLLGRPGEVYNIGADSPEISVVDLCERIAAVIGREVPTTVTSPPDVYTNEPLRRCPDIMKARIELGYDPLVTLDDGLREFFEWALVEYPKGTAP